MDKCTNTVKGDYGYDDGCDEKAPVCADKEGNPVGYKKKGFKCIKHPTSYVSLEGISALISLTNFIANSCLIHTGRLLISASLEALKLRFLETAAP